MPETVVYCSWDEASPRSIPPRSYLYRVAPMGVGSANVESLTSYLARLAAAHDISPAVLLTGKYCRRYARNSGVTITKLFTTSRVRSCTRRTP